MPPSIPPGPWYPPTWARRPPGMTWEDWQAWEPWMRRHGHEWPEWAYNVRLSIGDPEIALPDAESERIWREITAKRIDAIGRRDGKHSIFEARRIAGWSAVGQLLGYRELWYLDQPDLELDELWLISESMDPSVRALAYRQGIRTWCCDEP